MRSHSHRINQFTGVLHRAWPMALLVGLLAPAGCKESAPEDVFINEASTEAIVFVKTEAEETLNRSWASSNLYKLSPISPDGQVTNLTDFTGASVSDPCVSFDGERILFSMRPPGAGDRNIFEISTDGTGLRQITSGGGHDFDPLYLPDGRIMFTSSRSGEMDEYNHSPAEHLHTCNGDGSNVERVSFNQSDDFDPVLMANGRILYTRWDHFGTFNRFPLFVTNPDGTGTFHHFGPHNRNFFHPQATPDGRMVAIESTMVNEDAGRIAILKPEAGPADPTVGDTDGNWDVLTPQVNTDGAPWAYGAFKYPFPLGGNRYVVSYTLPAAEEIDVDYGLYTFALNQSGTGTPEDPATISLDNLTFLYNDPMSNEYDAQLIAPHDKPPVIAPVVDHSVDYGVFIAQDVFFRGTSDGQERPQRGIDPITEIAVYAARPTRRGERDEFSANEFEKRSLLGFAPVESDGSFAIRVPADTPVSFATLDEHRRGLVVKRTWLYVRPGETFDRCTGCHEDRGGGAAVVTNPNPIAANVVPTDLNIPEAQRTIINFENDIAPIVANKCVSCHFETYNTYDQEQPDGSFATVTDTIPAPGGLDLTDTPDTLMMDMAIFPRGYINLSGESELMDHQVVRPVFPRRSLLIDYVMGLGTRDGMPSHPEGAEALTPAEIELFNYWVLLGAQYK
ncbi:hypothetical protein DRQ53_11395 [bacterium]|nr:MAG: hypothetical protein DRQ53_11395 [bacterium]